MDERIKKYLPDTTHIYYVDYRSDLSESVQLLQRCVEKNSLQPLSEKIWDWWENPEGYEMDSIREAMEKDDLEELYEEYEEDIRDWVLDHDVSTPVEDLIRNTPPTTFFYSLGLEVGGWCGGGFMCTPYRSESEAMAAYRVARKLGIRKGTYEYKQIEQLVAEAGGGGELRIYFESKVDYVVSGEEENRLYWTNEDGKEDWKSISFDGDVAVAIYNSSEGSGWETTIKLKKTFPFIRENLYVSETEKWDLESVFGMCGDWLREKDYPVFSYKNCRGVMKESKTAVRNKREAELTKVFREGKCTFGDMDINRHRDVYYKNEIPCGMHCPHCGTFWID